MIEAWIEPALHVAAWTLTFVLHATLLIALAVLVARRVTGHALRERLWKVAFVGAFATATLSALAGDTGLNNRWALRTVRGLGPASASPGELVAVGAHETAEEPTESSAFVPPTAPGLSAPGLSSETRHAEAPNVWDDQGGSSASRPRDRASRPVAYVPSAAHVTSRPAVAQDESTLTPPPLSTSALVLLILGGAWLVGALGFLSRWGWAWRRLMHQLSYRRPLVEGVASDMLSELAERASRRPIRVRLSASSSLASPISFGIVRPEICIPERALDAEHGLRREELRALLAHELAHIERRDPLWLALCGVLENVFFFQPLLRLARRRWRDDAELCCDDWAVRRTGDPLPLAACLTEVAGWIVRDPGSVPALGMAASGRGLGGRVRRLIEVLPEEPPRRWWVAPASLVALGGIALAAPSVDAVRPASTIRADDVPATSEDTTEDTRVDIDEPGSEPRELEPEVWLASEPQDVQPERQDSWLEPSAPRAQAPQNLSTSPRTTIEPSRPILDDASVDDESVPERIIGPRVRRPLPAPSPRSLHDELAALDRELLLLAREAAALQEELERGDYPSAWRERAQARAQTLLVRIARLDVLRVELGTLLETISVTTHVEDRPQRFPAQPTGSRSGPLPSR